MEKDKASTPNKEKDIHVGRASEIEMATEPTYIEMAKEFLEKLDNKMRINESSTASSPERRMAHSSIYSVPKPLRNVYPKAYTPQLISIGPLHRENKKLAMEKEKLKYFKKLTERMDKKKRRDIVTSIKNQEESLRNSYSEKLKKIESSDDFVEMILLDAVFIILFFLESNDEKGPKLFKPSMTFDIREDLMLLENQLPLFIIEKIYDKVSYHHSSVNKPKSFLDLATYYLREYLHLQVVETSPGVEKETSSDIETGTSSDIEKEPRHLTDLLRDLMLSIAIQRIWSPDLARLKYSATMLHKAGVRFQVTRDECLVNIKFDKGVLKIPHLKVDHNFERRVRNVMAMEQCLYEHEAYICSYIKFMDHLIDSAGDVGLLVENGIILHWLGDDAAVSKMINNLCKNIGDNDTCFGDISQELNTHYENRWNHVKYMYFRNMWRGTGTITGAILLILTFIQTVSSVKSLL